MVKLSVKTTKNNDILTIMYQITIEKKNNFVMEWNNFEIVFFRSQL